MSMFVEALRSYDFDYLLQWTKSNWTLSIYISLVYVIAIFWGQSVMKHRPAYNLRPLLFVWSFCLALFSMWGAYRVFNGIISDASENGWLYTVCSLSYLTEQDSQDSPLWAFLFMFSKLPELGDTIFIVLRKQKLIFLHWYHHITVFMYCWYSYGHPIATGRWFSAMNFLVHAIMYTHYALSAAKIRTPKFVKIGITSLQILQMFGGIGLNMTALKMIYSGESCYVSVSNIVISLCMYSSYCVLFCNFFFATYFGKKDHDKKDKAQVESLANKTAIKKEEEEAAGSENLKHRIVSSAR